MITNVTDDISVRSRDEVGESIWMVNRFPQERALMRE